MKFDLSAVFLFFLGACSALSTAKATIISLDKRSPTPLIKEINRPNIFYRAVTGKEVAHIDNYPLNGHPRSFLNTPGDFSATGGLYVFHDSKHAGLWGDSHQNVVPSGEKNWYMVEIKYKPEHGLSIQSFLTGTNEWKNFVNGCDEGNCPTTHDIVEGPISIYSGARRQPYLEGGKNLLYQAAFTSPRALNTLTVTKVTKRTVGRDPDSWCERCNIQ